MKDSEKEVEKVLKAIKDSKVNTNIDLENVEINSIDDANISLETHSLSLEKVMDKLDAQKIEYSLVVKENGVIRFENKKTKCVEIPEIIV